MDPEVPQALRLQAILASGIVKLHEKKVDYLKEDAEHAMVSIWSSTSSISSRCSNLHTYTTRAEEIMRYQFRGETID